MKHVIVLSFVVLMFAFGCKKDEPAAAAAAPGAAPGAAMAAAPAAAPGAAMAAAPGAAMAAAPGAAMAAPAAGGGGSCAAYARCCTAIAAMPNMASMAAACAQAPQLTALGPTGESVCAQTLSGLRQGLSAMPGGAPAACNP